MNLEFGNPAGLWALTLLVPLVLLYILRMRRRRVAVPAAWLWRAAEQELRARTPLRRLTPQVSLLLQCLAVLLLAAALADPSARSSAMSGDQLALVVDSGASMAAAEPGQPTRMAQAIERSKQLVRNLPPGTNVLVVQAGRQPQVVSGLERDHRRILAALDTLRVRHERSHVERAVSVAVERLGRLPGSSQVLVVGDASTTLPPTPASGPSLRSVRVGGPVANVGITRLDIRHAQSPPRRVEVFATLRNFDSAPTSRFVTLRRRNSTQAIASRRFALQPGEQAPVTLSFSPAATDAGTGLVLELSPSDGFPVDDRAFAIVPSGPKLQAFLSPPNGNAWIARALAADPDVQLREVSREEHRTVDFEDSFNVFTGYCPERAPPADVLIVDPPRGRCITLEVGDQVQHPLVTSWAVEDPRMRFLTLEGLSIRRARGIHLSGPRGALLRAGGETLIADMDLVGRTGTLVAFDVGQSDWPLRASFVLFIRNLLEMARAAHSRRLPDSVARDGAIQVRVPMDVTEVRVDGPQGTRQSAPARDGIAVVPTPPSVGHTLVSWKGDRPGSTLLAASLTDSVESDINRARGSTGTGHASEAAQEPVETLRRWAWLVALVATLALLAEVWWETRLPRRLALGSPAAPPPRRVQ